MADIEILDAVVDQDSFWFSGASAKRIVERIHRTPDEELDVFINSPGGSASAGMTIAHTLALHRPTVRVHVLGVAASAAGLIALGAGTDELHMPAGSFVMIHLPLMWTVGDAPYLRATADLLDQWTGEIATMLHQGRLSDLTEDAIVSLMEETAWIGSADMIAAGRAVAGAVEQRHAGAVLDSLQNWSRSDLVRTAVEGWDEHVGGILEAVPPPAAEPTPDGDQLAELGEFFEWRPPQRKP